MPPQIRRVRGLTREKVIWAGPNHETPMTTEELLSGVWVNLRPDNFGTIMQDHQDPEELWDLQPCDNPHQVAWWWAHSMLFTGNLTLATEDEVKKAVAARAKDPLWADHPGRSRRWVEPIRPELLAKALPPVARLHAMR